MMFERGRIDHFALLAPSEEAFREIRRRLESEGAAGRPVRDTKTAWIMDFHDPDGLYAEASGTNPARGMRKRFGTPTGRLCK